MLLDCKFKHLDFSEPLYAYAQGKMEHLMSKVPRGMLSSTRMYVTVSKENHNKLVEITIKSAKQQYHVKVETDDYYTSMDVAFQGLKRQLFKQKDKMYEGRRESKRMRRAG